MSIFLHSYAYFQFRNINTEHAPSGEKKKSPKTLEEKSLSRNQRVLPKCCFIYPSKTAECQELHKERISKRGKGIHNTLNLSFFFPLRNFYFIVAVYCIFTHISIIFSSGICVTAFSSTVTHLNSTITCLV